MGKRPTRLVVGVVVFISHRQPANVTNDEEKGHHLGLWMPPHCGRDELALRHASLAQEARVEAVLTCVYYVRVLVFTGHARHVQE